MRKLAAYWQSVLIPEWTVILRFDKSNRAMKVAGELCDGLSWWSTEECTAQIWIRRGCQHREETLVHEMLHICNEGHREKEDHYDPMYERSLNKQSELLVKLRRGK
jgi:hypothetical protein